MSFPEFESGIMPYFFPIAGNNFRTTAMEDFITPESMTGECYVNSRGEDFISNCLWTDRQTDTD